MISYGRNVSRSGGVLEKIYSYDNLEYFLAAAIMCLVLEMLTQLPYFFLTFAIFFLLSSLGIAVKLDFSTVLLLSGPALVLSFFLTRTLYKLLTIKSVGKTDKVTYIGQTALLRLVEETEGSTAYFYGYKETIGDSPVAAQLSRNFLRAVMDDGSVHEVDWIGRDRPQDGDRAVVVAVNNGKLSMQSQTQKGHKQ
jgi:hypothetical protein